MEQHFSLIGKIPSVLWGPVSDKLLVAVHGGQSSKTDVVMGVVAAAAAEKGRRVLSFDLPGHGDRKGEQRLCDAQNCVEDLQQVMQYARSLSRNICLFGCSTGAYYSMVAYRMEPIQKALFLSPFVDMKRLIHNMMMWFTVTEEQLQKEGTVDTPVSTLYWHDYQYVLRHPVDWNKPTALLCGAKDELCELAHTKAFAKRCHASITVLDDSEHFFHTEEQLAFLREWLRNNLPDEHADHGK